MDLFAYFDGKDELMVLDLGCGVGRNSIPMAKKVMEKQGQIICVDLLETALTKLMAYSKEHGVENFIEPVRCDIGEYAIQPNQFDVIIAVSSLEHVNSKETLTKVLVDMANGTKNDGIICIILNSNVKETDLITNQSLEPLIEVNMTTDESWELLKNIYYNWEHINSLVKPLELEINALLLPLPHWAAYQASKAAFDTWFRSAAPELNMIGISTTSIYLPLVRTPMILPTAAYHKLPAMLSQHVAKMICNSIYSKRKIYKPWWLIFGQLASVLLRRYWEYSIPRKLRKKGERP